MNIKKITVAVAGALLVVGCASNPLATKKAEITPESDSLKPKPISTIFHRPEGPMIITFSSDGKFLEITARGIAPIHGNNASSIDQAATVAQMRAKQQITEFISTQLNTTRSVKVLSTAVQKTLENTNGTTEEVKVDDKDFDSNGDPVVVDAYKDGDKDKVAQSALKEPKEGNPNINSQKIAEIVRENITTSATALLKGVVITNENIDQKSRTIVVEVKTGVNTIGAANELRKLMGSN